MSTHDEKQASVGEALVDELARLVYGHEKQAKGAHPVRFESLTQAAQQELRDGIRAVLSRLTRRGQDEIRGAFPTDEETLRSCDGLSIDALTVLNTKQALEARIVARIGPLLAAGHVALADAHGELQRLWATRDERDEIYRELVNARKAHQDCYLGWNACMKERDAILAARDAALEEARAEIERLREQVAALGIETSDNASAVRKMARDRADAVARAEAAEKRLADVRDLLRDWRGLMTSWTFGERAKETLDYCAKQLAKSLGEDWR